MGRKRKCDGVPGIGFFKRRILEEADAYRQGKGVDSRFIWKSCSDRISKLVA